MNIKDIFHIKPLKYLLLVSNQVTQYFLLLGLSRIINNLTYVRGKSYYSFKVKNIV